MFSFFFQSFFVGCWTSDSGGQNYVRNSTWIGSKFKPNQPTQFKVQFKPTLQYIKKMPEVLSSTLPRSCVRANRLSKTQSWYQFNFRFWNEFLFKHNCYFFWGRARSWGRKRVFVLLLLAPLSVDSRLNIVKYRTLPAPSLPVNEKIETQKRREKSIRTSVDTSKVFVLGAHSPFRHACSFGIEITMEIEVDRTPA